MELTPVARDEYDHIANTSMTADEAFDYLNKNIEPRPFSEVLERFYTGTDIKRTLCDALCDYSNDISRESMQKKIRGWLNGKYLPSDRETYLQICFALQLDEISAQRLLCCCSDCGFHYRNPRELVYSFALRIGMKYHEAVELFNSLPPLPDVECDETVYTETLYNEFNDIEDVDEFKSFYMSNLSKLGTLHNTAYKYFMSFIDCLRDPDANLDDWCGSDAEKSQRFSIEKITDEYLRMDVPAESGNYNNIQKNIKKYWPSATSIKNMCSRNTDITRKSLILLYVITEGIVPDANYDFVIDDDLTPWERFEEHYDKLCIMLTDCGMATPDPCNAFDWMVLYSLKTENYEEIQREMQEILNRVFNLTETNLTE